MNESKFTPGPWEVVGPFNDRIYHEPTDTVVAQAWYPGASSKSPSPADTMQANARLIAAAPEMYEELKAIEALLSDPRTGKAGASGSINLARSVLSKAEGKTP